LWGAAGGAMLLQVAEQADTGGRCTCDAAWWRHAAAAQLKASVFSATLCSCMAVRCVLSSAQYSSTCEQDSAFAWAPCLPCVYLGTINDALDLVPAFS
jgi:hypothetical protein